MIYFIPLTFLFTGVFWVMWTAFTGQYKPWLWTEEYRIGFHLTSITFMIISLVISLLKEEK